MAIQDEASRCSFYSVSPRQVVLFRGGWMDDDDDDDDDDVDPSSGGENDAPPRPHDDDGGGRMVPVIVFSSTTSHLRSRLRAMGVDLRLLSSPRGGKHREGGGTDAGGVGHNLHHALFSESLFGDADDCDKATTEGGGDAVSVHAELDAIKRADDENGKVTVEVKTKRRRRRKYGKPPSGDGADLRSPLFVCGDDDCSAVYELLVNTCGLSVFDPEAAAAKPRTGTTNGAAAVSSDVPLLLSRRVFFSCHPCLSAVPLLRTPLPLNGIGRCIPPPPWVSQQVARAVRHVDVAHSLREQSTGLRLHEPTCRAQ